MSRVAFTQEIFDTICDRIANGEGLRSICAEDGMPDKSTVLRWLQPEEAKPLRDQYARARESQADTLFDECLEIADNAKNDWMEKHGQDDTGWQLNSEHIQRSRLRIDARRWMAGKLRPKVYGEKQVVEGPGENGEFVVKWQRADD